MLAITRRMNPPENEIPVSVPISTLLARTDDIAVALIGAQAYTSGLRFDLAIRLRNEPRGSMRHRTYAMLNAYRGGEETDEQFLLGVEYPDGRTTTNFARPGFDGIPADEPQKPSLAAMGGSGGGRSYDQSYWLTPLPPAGPLVVVCAWSAFDIIESRTVVDGAAIAAAGTRAVVLWPWSPSEDDGPFEPPAPRVPDGGWFDRVNRAGPGNDRPLG